MAMVEVAVEEAMVVDAVPPEASRFTLLQAEQSYNLALSEEHRAALAQLEVEHLEAASMVELFTVDPNIVTRTKRCSRP